MTAEHSTQEQTGRRGVWGYLVLAAVLLFIILLASSLMRAQQGPVRVGSIAPQFTLTTFDGETYHTEDYAGQVIVVNFWASWCQPCELEAVELEQAYQMYNDQGVVFLGVDYTDTEPEARAYLERFGVTYPNGPDLRTAISQAYRTVGVPETYIIGPDGTLAAVMIGPYQSLNDIIADIELALQEQ
jgi:cytochrome c biogenesis protein CcmG/thiol:disulfide interchange protein DsbE